MVAEQQRRVWTPEWRCVVTVSGIAGQSAGGAPALRTTPACAGWRAGPHSRLGSHEEVGEAHAVADSSCKEAASHRTRPPRSARYESSGDGAGAVARGRSSASAVPSQGSVFGSRKPHQSRLRPRAASREPSEVDANVNEGPDDHGDTLMFAGTDGGVPGVGFS